MITFEDLLLHSGLPGPRANLSLFHRFLQEPDPSVVERCLGVVDDETANSPQEFAGMCGVAGWALLHAADRPALVAWLRRWASHPSWRIREAVAMVIQELPFTDLGERCDLAAELLNGDPLVGRAAVAGLCEPKNLKGPTGHDRLLSLLTEFTLSLDHEEPLSEPERVLRQALGYGWSVAVAACPTLGLPRFEALKGSGGRHRAWIVAENLKKKRMPR